MKTAFKLVIAVCALAPLLGCGSPGAPMLPSLQLARPPLDVAAARKGNRVTLTWTPPTQTTDGQSIRAKYAGPTLICRAVSAVPLSKCEPIGQASPFVPPPLRKGEKTPPPAPQRQFVDVLPPDLQRHRPTGFAEYGVEVENTRGRSAGLSNQVRVPLAPTLPPPTEVRAQVTADGIVIRWSPESRGPSVADLSSFPRVYRRDDSTNIVVPLPAAAEGTDKLVDHTFEWEKHYTYWVTMVTRVAKDSQVLAEVEGDDSRPVTVFAHDIFPPAVPVGLQAVASGVGQKPFIDLTWVPDTAPDLAGYQVYRQEPGGTWDQISPTLLTTPSFRDEKVVSGRSYTYAVSAIDVRGNESAKSAPATEAVP